MLYNSYYDKLVTIVEFIAIANREDNKDSNKIKELIGFDRALFDLNKEVPERKGCQYTPLLHIAVIRNSQEVVEALLRNGANPNILDEDGWTPLQVAVINDLQKVVRILLEGGADINAKNNKGNTALHLAVSDQNSDMVQIFLDNGANSSIKNQRSNAPLHIAINRSPDVKVHTKNIGKSNLPVATVTAQQISDYSNRETTQVIPINIKNLAKIQLGGITQGYSDSVKIIQVLLSHDAKKKSKEAIINQCDHNGYCPIHLAVQNNNLDVAGVLLSDSRIDVNVRTRTSGKTALMLAVRESHYNMIKLLLSHKDIDLNTEDFSGRIALEYVLESKCSDDIIAVLWRNIEERIRSGTMENCSIELEQDLEIEEKLDRLEKDHKINLRPMIEFTSPDLSESESEESDVSEESETSEYEESATLQHQETELEAEISDVEVGQPAKRQRMS